MGKFESIAPAGVSGDGEITGVTYAQYSLSTEAIVDLLATP